MAAQKLYDELAIWWPLLSAVEEYADEAAFFLEVFQGHHESLGQTMVEFGSGGGNNAFYLKKYYQMTLSDLSPDMLAISAGINPECEHIVGDMRTVRLGRQFDAVFIHDAIDYMTTEVDLRKAIETAFVHCKPGGMALLVPDHVRENFEAETDHGGHDGDGRALRYLEWSFDPNPADCTYETYYSVLMRDGDTMHMELDRHLLGLFSRADWLRIMTETGFETSTRIDNYERELFIGIRPLK